MPNLFNQKINFFAALYGVVFPNEEAAAFSNYRLWESLGFVVAYIYGNRYHYCVSHNTSKEFKKSKGKRLCENPSREQGKMF